MKRLVRLFSVALFMSFVVSVFYYKVIEPVPIGATTARQPVVPYCDEDRVLVVVSEINRHPGDGNINESSVKRIKYPEKLLPRYAPLYVRDVLGKAVDCPVYRGEIMNLQRVVEVQDNDAPIGVSEEHAWRTLVISGGQGFAPMLARGIQVDIAALYFCLPQGKNEPVEMCRTIVRRARVVEHGTRARGRLKGTELSTDDEALTFEMTKQAAAIVDLVKLQPKTSFYMILRSANYADDPDTEGFGVDQLVDRSVKRAFAEDESPQPFDFHKMKSARKELRDARWKTPPQPKAKPKTQANDKGCFESADFGDFGDDDDNDDYEFDAFDGFD